MLLRRAPVFGDAPPRPTTTSSPGDDDSNDMGGSGVLVGADGDAGESEKKQASPPPHKPSPREIRLGEPLLTITGTVHGQLDDDARAAAAVPRYSALASPARPLVAVRLCQPILHRAAPGRPWSLTALSVTTAPLAAHHPLVEVHVAHQIPLSSSTSLSSPRQALVEVSVSPPAFGASIPGVAVGARVDVGDGLGAVYVRVEGGDAAPTLRSADLCALLGVPTVVPRVHVGFESAGLATTLRPLASTTPPEGMHALDGASGCRDGAWTVAVAGSPAEADATVRYTRDVASSYAVLSPRVEVEVCASSLPLIHSHRVSLRALWPVGRHSRLGIEYAATPAGSHVSLYWSRLGQRFGLPIAFAAAAPQPLAGWAVASVAPAAALVAASALASLWSASRRRRRRRRHAKNLDPDALALRVSRQRARAEDLAWLMAPVVEAAQRRSGREGGLVIRAAKFGLRDHSVAAAAAGPPHHPPRIAFAPEEEVADVRLALAALVGLDDDGGSEGGESPRRHVRVPAGVRWAALPGFWDPAPHAEDRDKVLVVRYALGRDGEDRIGVFTPGDEIVVA
jgi:DnaJ family protein C protein 11